MEESFEHEEIVFTKEDLKREKHRLKILTYFKGVFMGVFFNIWGLICTSCMKNKYFKEGYFVGLLMFTVFMFFTGVLS